MSASVTDSLFTWTFTALSGDSWGGTLVEDSSRYDVGNTQDTAWGRYAIVAEAPQIADLSEFGMNEGWISIAWYRDRTGSWMLTQAGEATAAGLGGLGSEADAAWNGTAWDSFGAGGADQADPGALPDSLFTWSFTADSGDELRGTLLADSRDWQVGDTLRTAHGSYRITAETSYGQDLGGSAAEGTVTTSVYRDGVAAVTFTLESGGTAPTGYGGLGSELDRAWTGSAWVQVGQGGALQADRLADRRFDWIFEASNGDWYTGSLVGHSTALAVGDTVALGDGAYRITAATALGGQVATQDTVWTRHYHDAGANRTLLARSYAEQGGAPTGQAGLGSEYDTAWDGREWDDFGRAGTVRADVDGTALYDWAFIADTGDVWGGRLVDDDEYFTPGQQQRTPYGVYFIQSKTASAAAAPGTVWTDVYYDRLSGDWTRSFWNQYGGGGPSGGGGLGSEYDYVFNGSDWSPFGWAGALQADIRHTSLYSWAFIANSGDVWGGRLAEDSTRYAPGDQVRTAQGVYLIQGEAAFAGGAARGTIWTDIYYDASAARWARSFFDQIGGQPSGAGGLGSEYDYVWNGARWDEFGYGGALQADYV